MPTLTNQMFDPNFNATADSANSRAPLPTVAKPDIEDAFQSLTLADVGTQKPSITPTWSTSQNISLLPNELMAEIFAISCHADPHTFSADKNRHKRTTPLILGKICTQWRAIIWSTPYIWSHIYLCLSTTRYETQVKLLSDWLTRSGVCPLTIILIFDCEDDWVGSETIPIDLIQLLMVSANRWRIINFVLPELWYSILAELRFPLLVTVISQPLWADCVLCPSRRKRFNLFEFAPLLRNIHVNGYYLSHVDVPWDQLDRVTLQHVYLDECFYALARTPKLRFCRVYTILLNDVNREIAENSIVLPLLRELVIDSATWADISRLLGKMIVPLIETLEIFAPGIDNGPPALFPRDSKCFLKRLKLTEWFFCEGSELVQCLRNIPSLEELEISMAPASVPINELPFHNTLGLAIPNSSIISDDDITFLPNLQVFKFFGHILVKNNNYDDYLTSLFERRLEYSKQCSPISRLKVFHVITEKKYPFTPNLSVKRRLSKLVDEGLQLKIEFSGVSWF